MEDDRAGAAGQGGMRASVVLGARGQGRGVRSAGAASQEQEASERLGKLGGAALRWGCLRSRRSVGGRRERLCALSGEREWAAVDVMRAVFVRAGLVFVVLPSLER